MTTAEMCFSVVSISLFIILLKSANIFLLLNYGNMELWIIQREFSTDMQLIN